MRRTLTTLGIVLTLIGAVPAVPVAAGHYTYCKSQIDYAFAGQKRVRTGGIQGISAELEDQSLYPCAIPSGETGPGNVTWMWVALEGPCGGSGNCIIQIGIGKGTRDARMGWWWAWGRHPNAPGCAGFSVRSPTGTRFADWNGQQSQFQIRYVNPSQGSDYWGLYIDGVAKKTVYASSICWDVTAASWFGETPNQGSAIGGDLNDPFLVYAARYRIPGSTTWYTPSWADGRCDIENPKPPYNCTKVAHDSLHVWTRR